jgi:hypothetical protein
MIGLPNERNLVGSIAGTLEKNQVAGPYTLSNRWNWSPDAPEELKKSARQRLAKH